MKIAYQYMDYLREVIVAAGDDEIARLDLSATTIHYTSSGACDPIVECGIGALYRIVDVDVPSWLVAGVVRGQQDGRWSGKSANVYAARIALGYESGGWVDGVRALIGRRGKFADSVRAWYVATGMITDRQSAALLRWS